MNLIHLENFFEQVFSLGMTIVLPEDDSEKFLPWEYVQKKEDRGAIDLNYGAVSCNGDYIEDNRLYMFVQREDGSVKPAGQITGGYLENKYETGDVYLHPVSETFF